MGMQANYRLEKNVSLLRDKTRTAIKLEMHASYSLENRFIASRQDGSQDEHGHSSLSGWANVQGMQSVTLEDSI